MSLGALETLVVIIAHLYTNTVLDVTSVCPSVILSVRYRNHFSVVRFQNQAHNWNSHGTGHVFKTIFSIAAEGGVS